MGCFLACIGSTKKQKRLKSARTFQLHKASRQGLGGCYQQLESVSVKLERSTYPEAVSADSDLKKEKQTLRSVLGAKKKVSFNLNVRTYELIESKEFSECEDDENLEKDEKVGATEMDKSTSSYPSDYRYKNFIDPEDGDDDDYVSDDDEEEDFDDCREDCSSDEELDQSTQGKADLGLSDIERLREAHSVLSPVENTAQWRAVKVKTTASQSRHQCKENVENVSLDQRIHTFSQQENLRVDASLSNWILGNAQHNLMKAPLLRTI